MNRNLVLVYESVMVLLAIVSVTMIWSDNESLYLIDRIVWFIFLVDVSIRFYKSKGKWEYIKTHPLDFIAIIPFDAIFQLARIARLFRAIRLIAIGAHFLKPVFDIVRTNGLHKVITCTAILIFVSAIPIKTIEPSMESYADALWWSIVTATTVGYGDISPETNIGRVIALILMIFGIGLIGMITGSIATYFLSGQQKEHGAIEFIKSELSRYEELSEEEFERLLVLMNQLRKEKKKIG
ncbi:potassium voltage-gated channel subfamily KQT [Halalkalibacter wakoensis JCM 9140]|uniref:Potassium voltage-gated channel subfamily KQT n=1 Tax=Halalkalibacter wakoensis JCM 9140 TaxID=1236970 RepID=W4Q9C9_9BACI|nr:potassium channel family protein [Halalkalibacter wakoensis]GAE28605.1 potassium voltage-gated channel subfamily KQT [Halalkalibacter wakoensis JCM 9140]